MRGDFFWQVAGLIVTALERGSDRLLQHLIGPGQLIHWLTSAPEAVTPQPRASDASAGALTCTCPSAPLPAR